MKQSKHTFSLPNVMRSPPPADTAPPTQADRTCRPRESSIRFSSQESIRVALDGHSAFDGHPLQVTHNIRANRRRPGQKFEN